MQLNATESTYWGYLTAWASTRELAVTITPQVWIGRHRADFVASGNAWRWVVEIDGPAHETPDAKERDRLRTVALFHEGYSVVRLRAGHYVPTPRDFKIACASLDIHLREQHIRFRDVSAERAQQSLIARTRHERRQARRRAGVAGTRFRVVSPPRPPAERLSATGTIACPAGSLQASPLPKRRRRPKTA